nr:immunoglobulin kappa light chain [Acipenser ruthenus]
MSMISLLATLLILIHDLHGQIVMDQSPASLSVLRGQSVTIKCKAGSSVSSEGHWYQFKEGETPKLLIYWTNNRHTGVPSRFSGSQSGTELTFTISNVQPEDDGDYFCQQDYSTPFGQGTKVVVKSRALASPVVSLLPPSAEELSKNWATLVCLVDKFYPDIVEVVWEIDDKSQTDGILNSKSLKASDNTYSMSSILTLTRAKWESSEKYSCIIKHENSAAPIVSTINRSQCTTA